MSREIEKIAEDLFEKIRSRFDNVRLGDGNAKDTNDPEKARFFNFDYISEDGENFGNVTVSLIDENSLKIYYSKNISHKLEPDQRKDWYEFLQNLRYFAKRNLLTFDTRDISRSSLNLKDLKQVSKSDSTLSIKDVKVTESRLYGTPMTSFENVGAARIRIVHTESVNPEVRGSRSRHINAIFIENNQGERFKMEFNKLSGARAMARHISEGGMPYDQVGEHIKSMVREMNDLGRFVRTMKHRVFEDSEAIKMVEAASSYYHGMNRQLNYLKGPKAYKSFVENFQPQTEQLDEVDVNQLKEKFVKKIFDDRMLAALPLVHKAYRLQEQAQTRQLQLVRDVVENRLPLKLIANEGMDEYIKALSFAQPTDIVVKVLEDIATRALATPEVAEFAKHWANNYNTVTETADQLVREHQALAVKLATHYLRDLRNLREGLRISEDEISYVDFDSGEVLEEGTWAIPETPEDIQELQALMANPMPVGTDGENATSALYNLIGDDELFDRLSELANSEGPKADARDTIKYYLQQEMPGIYDKLGITANDQEMDEPVPAAAPTPTTPPPEAPAGAAAPGTTPPAIPGGTTPMTEDPEFLQLMRLSGVQTFLVK